MYINNFYKQRYSYSYIDDTLSKSFTDHNYIFLIREYWKNLWAYVINYDLNCEIFKKRITYSQTIPKSETIIPEVNLSEHNEIPMYINSDILTKISNKIDVVKIYLKEINNIDLSSINNKILDYISYIQKLDFVENPFFMIVFAMLYISILWWSMGKDDGKDFQKQTQTFLEEDTKHNLSLKRKDRFILGKITFLVVLSAIIFIGIILIYNNIL